MRLFWFVSCLLQSALLFGQTPSHVLYNHKNNLALLGTSKDSLYSKILLEYERYLRTNANDYKVQLERCRFIEKAYYDYNEDYNPQYEEAARCTKHLIETFPENPEVLLYGAEGLYGDSLTMYLRKLERMAVEKPSDWKGYSWKVYELLAVQFEGEENSEVIHYGELAMVENDTLDLTLLLGRAYKESKHNKKAIDILLSRLDSTQDTWLLNQKGKLLLELNAPDPAIRAFRMANRDTSQWQDSGSLAQALIESGLTHEARPYLVKQANSSSWNNGHSLYKLFDYDLKYSSADSAKASYIRLAGEDVWMDPMGIARVRLFFKAPFTAIHWRDFVRLGILLFTLVLIVVVPYVIVLPIHFIGSLLFSQKKTNTSRWGLVHVWMAFSFYLLANFTAMLLYNYEYVISIFNSNFDFNAPESISAQNASIALCFFSLTAFLTGVFLQKIDFQNLWQKIVSERSHIAKGIGINLLLRAGLVFYLAIVKYLGWFPGQESLVILTVNDEIISINKFYGKWIGFLFVVIVVPIYEEILFRGVFLSACEKHIKFFAANSLQAFVFALAHQNLKLFIFYFAFGWVAGFWAKRSGSLTTSISMHMFNNLLAFVAITALQQAIEI
jgi:membrane protease YdiL (CAAX protease family)